MCELYTRLLRRGANYEKEDLYVSIVACYNFCDKVAPIVVGCLTSSTSNRRKLSQEDLETVDSRFDFLLFLITTSDRDRENNVRAAN